MSVSRVEQPANPNPLLTVSACAEYLTLSEAFIRKIIASGDLPAHRFGRAVRVQLSDLTRYAEGASR